MSIKKHFKTHRGKYYMISPRFSGGFSMKKQDPPINAVQKIGQQCRMELYLCMEFNAVEEYFEKAERHAQRCLMESLYGDALAIVRELRNELYGGDVTAALWLLEELEREMTEVEER